MSAVGISGMWDVTDAYLHVCMAPHVCVPWSYGTSVTNLLAAGQCIGVNVRPAVACNLDTTLQCVGQCGIDTT
jgi:hypothetical protein